jgi:hypothetical protein
MARLSTILATIAVVAGPVAGCGSGSGLSDTAVPPGTPATTAGAATSEAATLPVLPPDGTTSAVTLDGVPGALPDGVYRVTITDADIAALNRQGPDLTTWNPGIYTFTFNGGEWTVKRRPLHTGDPPSAGRSAEGSYVVDGVVVTFHFRSSHADTAEPFTWKVVGQAGLQFNALPRTSPSFAVVLSSRRLMRVR